MIENWREIVLANPDFHISVWGLIIGLIFGFVVNRTNYCAMGAISDIENFGDYRRFRSWIMAAAVAMIGAWIIQSLEVLDLSSSIYLTTNFNIVASIVGGLMFGYGMVFAGGCVTKNIVRFGGGDLRSAINLVIVGIFAYMTIGGILGLVRTSAFNPFVIDLAAKDLESQSIGSLLSMFTGGDVEQTNLIAMIVIALVVLIWCFKDKGFRYSPTHIASGFLIGLCVIAAWFLTGLASDDLAEVIVPVSSVTFVRPTGDTLEYLMRFTALGAPSIGVVIFVGTLTGSFIAALTMKRFRLSTFAGPRDTTRNLLGAALMGIGGVLALGCTVGQAITGVSTLAVGSMIVFAAIVGGCFIGLKHLNSILMAEV
ncbi:MAG: YeeE/YedE family protein [Hyphomicrobiales bacterium]|nr:YeeE/YedE family protein [Hyphomicrobiales bacterium]